MQLLLSAQSFLLAQADTAVASPSTHGLIYTCIIGLVVGVIAKFLTPGRDPGGCIITMLIGIAGSFIAYFIGRALGMYARGDVPGIIMSIIGAVILLAVYHLAIRNKRA